MSRLQGQDPKGAGVNEQKVDKEGNARVFAVVISNLEHESEKNGKAYNWTSGVVDIDSGDTVLLVKNTSDTPLHIEIISIANGSLASAYTVHLPTTEVTPAGVTVTGTNLNTGKSEVAEAISKSDETDNTQGNIIAVEFMAVDADVDINVSGLILGKNKSVAVDVTENTVESCVTVIGHYED